MAGITWLHLSDWHQRGKDFDRDVVGDALLEDIQNRAQINADLAKIDFLVFSGDIAFSGQRDEYKKVKKHLFDPLLKISGLNPDHIFFVPGNHDLDWDEINYLPEEIKRSFTTDDQVEEWLTDYRNRNHILKPFATYTDFVSEFNDQEHPSYASKRSFVLDNGIRVGLLGLNSAMMCGRNKDVNGVVNDHNHLIVGEPQVFKPLKRLAESQVRIVVIHHPFEWLVDFDRDRVENRLRRECHFILCGHQHKPNISVERGMVGDCVIIPAGASYDTRVPGNPRYTNSYNFVHLDFETAKGTIYLRRWSESRDEWIEDIDSHKGGMFRFDLPDSLRNIGTDVLTTPVNSASTRQIKDAEATEPLEQAPALSSESKVSHQQSSHSANTQDKHYTPPNSPTDLLEKQEEKAIDEQTFPNSPGEETQGEVAVRLQKLTGKELQEITWLHISDLHLGIKDDYNSSIVREAFISDIQKFCSDNGIHLDLIFMTGDIAFSGQPEEYKLASQFFDQLLSTTQTPKEYLFVIPGNHDVNRNEITNVLSKFSSMLNNRDQVNELLYSRDISFVNQRLNNYTQFLRDYFGTDIFANAVKTEPYYFVRLLMLAGKTIAVLGLNSAWLSAGDNDRLNLLVGERQVRDVLKKSKEHKADYTIALMHHPFDWLKDFDEADTQALLMLNCHFILCGHLHQTDVGLVTSPDGRAMRIAAGALYERREYPNAYNIVHFYPENGKGTVYFRRYSDSSGGFFAKDTLTYRNVPDGQYDFFIRANTNSIHSQSSGKQNQTLNNLRNSQLDNRADVQSGLTPNPGKELEEKGEGNQTSNQSPGQTQQDELTTRLQNLSAKERQEITNAILNAYPDQGDLKIMLNVQLDKNLSALVKGNNLQNMTFNLVSKAQSEGWLGELIAAAHKYNPGNGMLQRCYQKYIEGQNLTTIQQARDDVENAQSYVQQAGALFIEGISASSDQFREAGSLLSKARQSTGHLHHILNTDASLPEPLKSNRFRIIAQIKIIYKQIDGLRDGLKSGIQGDNRSLKDALSKILGFIPG